MQEITKATDNFSMRADKGFLEGIYFDVNMHIELFDESGKLKHEDYVHNTVTTNGKTGIAAQCASSPAVGKMLAIAVGTGSPGANALGAEVARVAFTSNTSSTNVTTVVATFNAGTGTGAITEAGTFDNTTASSGNMWMSSSFSVINKGALDSLSITWTLQIS